MTGGAERAQRAAVVAEARSWRMTPYHHMARLKGPAGGVDCAMLLAEVYQRAGLIGRVEVPYYPPDWHLHRHDDRFIAAILARAVETASPRPGDVATWRIGHGFAHAAIVVDPGWPSVVHADMTAGCVTQADGTRGRHAFSRNGMARPVRFFTLWPETAA